MKDDYFIIDANILISAFLSRHTTTSLAYDKAKGLGELAFSRETYGEFCDVFMRTKFDQFVSRDTRLNIIKGLKEVAIFSEITEKIRVCRDSNDDKFLELAVSVKASCIITGDKDLLILHPFENIPIVSAADFLENF